MTREQRIQEILKAFLGNPSMTTTDRNRPTVPDMKAVRLPRHARRTVPEMPAAKRSEHAIES